MDVKYVDFTNEYVEESWKNQEDDTLLKVNIDGYPADETKEGAVIAKVILTKHKDVVVDWYRNDYRLNDQVKALVEESKIMLLQQYNEIINYVNF